MIGYGAGVSVVEIVFVYAVIPAGILALIALFTLTPKFSRTPRYRPGQSWDHPPVWWTANPDGVGELPAAGGEAESEVGRGGARGTW